MWQPGQRVGFCSALKAAGQCCAVIPLQHQSRARLVSASKRPACERRCCKFFRELFRWPRQQCGMRPLASLALLSFRYCFTNPSCQGAGQSKNVQPFHSLFLYLFPFSVLLCPIPIHASQSKQVLAAVVRNKHPFAEHQHMSSQNSESRP